MSEVVAMSKITTLKYKTQTIDIFIREKLGKHRAPYIVAVLPDGSEAHFAIKDQEVFDSTIKNKKILNHIKAWIQQYESELLISWDNSKKGKATKVPPKPVKGFLVKRVTKLEVRDDLKMILWFGSEARLVDFNKVIASNIAFTELSDPRVLGTVKITGSSLRWEDQDLDIEASDLYDVSTPFKTSFISKVTHHLRHP